MDKLRMAHEWFISSINNGKHVTIEQAWCYADAMQAEADKRKPSGLPEALREVDWNVAPEWAKYHQDGCNGYIWVCENFEKTKDAPSFGFTGSHIMERPQ